MNSALPSRNIENPVKYNSRATDAAVKTGLLNRVFSMIAERARSVR
jgi:hypothetical protein